jgi:hypothetical protein
VDSPVALCAWIVEKLWSWTDSDGRLENVLSRGEVLDNVMLYWLAGSGAFAAFEQPELVDELRSFSRLVR